MQQRALQRSPGPPERPGKYLGQKNKLTSAQQQEMGQLGLGYAAQSHVPGPYSTQTPGCLHQEAEAGACLIPVPRGSDGQSSANSNHMAQLLGKLKDDQ